MKMLQEFEGDNPHSFLGEQLSVIENMDQKQNSIYTLMNNRITSLAT